MISRIKGKINKVYRALNPVTNFRDKRDIEMQAMHDHFCAMIGIVKDEVVAVKKTLASVRSNNSILKGQIRDNYKVVVENFNELSKICGHNAQLHDKKTKQYEQEIAELKQSYPVIAKKVDNLISRLGRMIKLEDEIDRLDKAKSEVDKKITIAKKTYEDLTYKLTDTADKFEKAMAVQGRAQVYELQGKKNEFIRDFELMVASRYPKHGRELESNQAKT